MVEAVRFPRRSVLIVLLVVVALLGAACSGEIALPDDADEELIAGSEVFRASCARCHGLSGGGGIGLSLRGVDTRLTDDEQWAVVAEGRRRMPAFQATLSEEDIDAVVRYTREVLSGG